MSAKRRSYGFIVILVAFFVFQPPKNNLCSGKSSHVIVINDDCQLALNDAQFKKLAKLEKQLKSKEKNLEKTKDQTAKLKKSR